MNLMSCSRTELYGSNGLAMSLAGLLLVGPTPAGQDALSPTYSNYDLCSGNYAYLAAVAEADGQRVEASKLSAASDAAFARAEAAGSADGKTRDEIASFVDDQMERMNRRGNVTSSRSLARRCDALLGLTTA